MKIMTELDEKFIKEALSLPSNLRTELIEKLIRSLNVPINDEIDKIWAKEAENRVSEVKSGDITLVSGDKVFKDINDRFEK